MLKTRLKNERALSLVCRIHKKGFQTCVFVVQNCFWGGRVGVRKMPRVCPLYTKEGRNTAEPRH